MYNVDLVQGGESDPVLRVDLEGQELLGVHVVEGAQLWKLQEQLGEDGSLVGVVSHNEVPQSPYQVLLQSLHRAHVLDACPV